MTVTKDVLQVDNYFDKLVLARGQVPIYDNCGDSA